MICFTLMFLPEAVLLAFRIGKRCRLFSFGHGGGIRGVNGLGALPFGLAWHESRESHSGMFGD